MEQTFRGMEHRPRRVVAVAAAGIVALGAQPVAAQVTTEPEYVRRYSVEGPPSADPVAEFVDATSFPPRLRAEPVDEPVRYERSELDVGDEELERARRAALRDPQVRSALGERYVEVAIGVDVPEKGELKAQSRPPVAMEFYSYAREAAFRVTVADERVLALQEMPAEYQPPETAEEIARAVEIVAEQPELAGWMRGAEAEGILTLCEVSRRCLYVQWVRENRIMLSAVVDMIQGRVLEVIENPDAEV